jgi:nitrate reductase NapE component
METPGLGKRETESDLKIKFALFPIIVVGYVGHQR